MQEKNKKTCEKLKAQRQEHMKHTEDLHIQYQVNEEYTKNTLKTENRRNRTCEDEKLKVETEEKVSEETLKRLERDREETAQEAQRELEEWLRVAQEELMADRERLQVEKISVEARKREVEEYNRDSSR